MGRICCRKRGRWWRGRWNRRAQEERTDWGVMQEKIRADLKRFLNKQTSAPAADHAGDSGSVNVRDCRRFTSRVAS